MKPIYLVITKWNDGSDDVRAITEDELYLYIKSVKDGTREIWMVREKQLMDIKFEIVPKIN